MLVCKTWNRVSERFLVSRFGYLCGTAPPFSFQRFSSIESFDSCPFVHHSELQASLSLLTRLEKLKKAPLSTALCSLTNLTKLGIDDFYENLEDSPPLGVMTNLTDLTFACTMRPPFFLSALTNLRRLTLKHDDAEDEADLSQAWPPLLEELTANLYNSGSTENAMIQLKKLEFKCSNRQIRVPLVTHLTNLRSLILDLHTDVLLPSDFFDHFPFLEEISVCKNDVIPHMDHLTRMTSITGLGIDAESALDLSHFTNLKRLECSRDFVGKNGKFPTSLTSLGLYAAPYANLSELTNLKKLRIYDYTATCEDIASNVSNLTNLQKLRVTSEMSTESPALQNLSGLRDLRKLKVQAFPFPRELVQYMPKLTFVRHGGSKLGLIREGIREQYTRDDDEDSGEGEL